MGRIATPPGFASALSSDLNPPCRSAKHLHMHTHHGSLAGSAQACSALALRERAFVFGQPSVGK
eukprot:12592441-Alexandrium_andersonii.AAC.1